MMHVLVGYTDKPNGLQLIAYLATLATIVILMRLVRAGRQPKPAS
jgi:high-affinity iron transporter